jgi:hypothetical protein
MVFWMIYHKEIIEPVTCLSVARFNCNLQLEWVIVDPKFVKSGHSMKNAILHFLES